MTPTAYSGYVAAPENMGNTEEMARLGAQAVFRARPVAIAHNILTQMERRDRIVLLLLDGKRTLQDVARLTHRRELETAYILVRLLKRGYIEFLGAPKRINDER